MIKPNEIICIDVLDGLSQIEDGIVSLTTSSPPYNVRLNYNSYGDDMPYAQYIDWLANIFTEVFRVTRDGGRLVINIDAMTNRQGDKDQEYIRPIYPNLYEVMKKIGWKFRTDICWYKQNAAGKKTAWGSYCSASCPVIRRTHEYVLVWSKGTWKLESDEQSDITPQEFHQYTLSTWFIQPETRPLCGHPAVYPEELVRRVIKLFSYPKDLVLDPFNGTGTTTAVAYGLGRRYIGIDIDKTYCHYAKFRTEAHRDLLDD